MGMAWYWVALLLFGSALGLMMLGIPVAIGFFITNVIAAILFMGGGPGIARTISASASSTNCDRDWNNEDKYWGRRPADDDDDDAADEDAMLTFSASSSFLSSSIRLSMSPSGLCADDRWKQK